MIRFNLVIWPKQGQIQILTYTVQFYAIKNNSKSNRWIELKLYQTIPEVFVYVRVNVQMNQSSEWTCDIG
jgi:hypothetical protein